MAKFLLTFTRLMSYEVEMEAETEDDAREAFHNDEASGEVALEIMEDKIVKVEEVGVEKEPTADETEGDEGEK